MKTGHNFSISRRSFLRTAGPGLAGTALAGKYCLRDLHLMNAALASGPFSDYKALVCIFLAGGNDSNNLIIPTEFSEYANYAAVRTPVLALPNADGSDATALALSALNAPSGRTFGINPAMKELQQMFNQTINDLGGVAPVFNMGNLVYPTTKAQYNAGTVPKPPQLFSHADQVTQWQTSIPDVAPNTGWGGRMADLMHAANPQVNSLDALSTYITIAGTNTFEVGSSVQQYSVGTGGVGSVFNPANPSTATTARQAALNSILGIDLAHSNYFTANYAKALNNSISTGSGLSAALGKSQMSSYWSTVANWSKTATAHQVVTPNAGSTFTSSLIQQLKMVAQIIEAGYRASDYPNGLGTAAGLGMKRQIFFVTVGGYDTHTGQTNNAGGSTTDNAKVVVGSQANLLAELSQGIYWFQKAMKQIGVTYGTANPFVNQVTCFTASDFGRTFPANGLGSDHGWGSHHLVVGGAVQGQKFYGTFPTLQVNGPDDTSTGRWIPTTSVDQYAGTLGKWLGLATGEMATVFPNLSRFAGSYNGGYLGFMG